MPALFIVTAALPAIAFGGEGQSVHRCVGAHGETMFSGVACAAPGRSGEDNRTSIDSPNTRCAATPADLRARITAAVATHDANAFAALLRWQNVGATAAATRLRELGELVARPLVSIDDEDMGKQPATSPNLRIRSGSNNNGGVRGHDFAVETDNGCYWLDW